MSILIYASSSNFPGYNLHYSFIQKGARIHIFCVTTTSYRRERVRMPSLREQLANLLN